MTQRALGPRSTLAIGTLSQVLSTLAAGAPEESLLIVRIKRDTAAILPAIHVNIRLRDCAVQH